MFGFSFSEVVLIGVVTLIAVGPKRLPGLLRDLAKWIRKLRKMTTEVRQQTGIDDMLRAEGLNGGLNELRSLMRGGGGLPMAAAPPQIRIPSPPEDPYSVLDMDVAREYPPEGPDSKGALPDDLTASDDAPAAAATASEANTVAVGTEPTDQNGNRGAENAKADAPMSKLPEQDKKPDVPEEQPQEQPGMTLWEHLDELRGRLVKMIVAFVIGGGLAWFKRKQLLEIITIPFVDAWNKGAHSGKAALHFPAPASLFLAYVRIAAIAGFVFSLPFILWQLWSFVAPGLYSKEKRYAAPFVICSCALFAGGGYFAWKIAFPLAFQFLLNMGEQIGQLEVRPTVMISDYLDFITRMGLAFGAAAELPILAFFLSVAGIITYKHLIKFFRYFLVVDFIIAAVITPPDVMSQLLLAIPLAGLYILSIGVAWLFGKKKPPEDDPPTDGAPAT